MTYPDDVLKAAREAAAQAYDGDDALMAEILRSGVGNGTSRSVKAACIAIMAERERCAEIADKQNWPSAKQIKTGDVRSFLQGFCAACDDIKVAILGQQEAANAQP